jgi:hypothetical protein
MVCVASLWSCFVIVVSAKFFNLIVYNVVEHRTKSLKPCFLFQHINSLIVRYCLTSVKWKSWTAIVTVSIHTCYCNYGWKTVNCDRESADICVQLVIIRH